MNCINKHQAQNIFDQVVTNGAKLFIVAPKGTRVPIVPMQYHDADGLEKIVNTNAKQDIGLILVEKNGNEIAYIANQFMKEHILSWQNNQR